MKQDDHRIRLLLQADADELRRMASVPTVHSILWKGKIRATRKRRQRLVALISLTEILGAGALALAIVGLVWTLLLDTPVRAHALTVVVAGGLTMVAVGVIATGSLIAVRSTSQ